MPTRPEHEDCRAPRRKDRRYVTLYARDPERRVMVPVAAACPACGQLQLSRQDLAESLQTLFPGP